MNNFQKIFTGFLSLSVGILAGIAYFQYSSLKNLQQQVAEIRTTALKTGPENNSALLENQSTQSQGDTSSESPKALIPTVNSIVGKIKEIFSDSLIIEANIPDISRLDQYSESKNEPIPRIIKTFKATINKDSVFFFKQRDDLKVGDWVHASASNPIYQLTEFIALFVSYLTEDEAKLLR